MSWEYAHDEQGNSYTPTTAQIPLVKAGWKKVSSRKKGMIRTICWRNPDTGEAWPQGVALKIESLRKQSIKQLMERK